MKFKGIILAMMLLLLPLSSTASAEVDEWGINHTYVREDGVEFEYSDMGYGQIMKGFCMGDLIVNDSHSKVTYMKFESIWQGGPADDLDFNESFENYYTDDYPFLPGSWQQYSQSQSINTQDGTLPTASQYRYRITVKLADGSYFVSNWERRYDTNFAIRDNGIVPIHEYDKTSHLFPPTDWSKYFQNVPRIEY